MDLDSHKEEVVSTSTRSAMTTSVANNGKNDIKVSDEGVAKLTFGFLDDMADSSSLEPGEVKTPPPGSSPASSNKDSTPLRSSKPEPPAKQLARDTLAKALKTVSQMEAEACEEKVRLILELDAKRRKEEKLECEKRRLKSVDSSTVAEDKKIKEERKQLKKLKKAQKAAKKALKQTNKEDEDPATHAKKRKHSRHSESDESEGLCSSGDDDDNDDRQTFIDKVSSAVSVVASSSAPSHFPTHMTHAPHPPPHLPPTDPFMSYRGMNPFMRGGARADFTHGRGGFIPRGRGGMRGRMPPFPGFRPPFFAGGGNNCGVGIPRHHGPQHRPHTPPPNRGHSPILPPSANLLWTKSKPSLSYAFKLSKDPKLHLKPHLVTISNLASSAKSNTETEEIEENWDNDDDDDHEKSRKNKETKKKSSSKDKKKTRKDKVAGKRRKKSPSLSMAKSSKKKKSKKSSRRKIEKIRKSYVKSRKPSEETENSSDQNPETEEKDEYIPDEEEIRTTVQNMKVEKVDTATELKIEDITLKVKPLIMIKQERVDNEAEETESNDQEKSEKDKAFDMFADSPPQNPLKKSKTTECSSTKNKKQSEIVHTVDDPSSSGIVTPPLPLKTAPMIQKASGLQDAMEIQKRIDKILQQDDIKLEAIEAAKEMLMRKTQKHQITKDKQLQSTTTKDKPVAQKNLENDKEDNRKGADDKKSQIKSVNSDRETPSAYKGKLINVTSKSKEDAKTLELSKQTNESIVKESKGKAKLSTSPTKKSDVKDRDSKYSKNSSEFDKEKYRKDTSLKARNPFKRSPSRGRLIEKKDARKRSRSRNHDVSSKNRMSTERKKDDSSSYSYKRRRSNSAAGSIHLNRSKSGERDAKTSARSMSKHKSSKDRQHSPETKTRPNKSPCRKSKVDGENKSKTNKIEDKKLDSNVRSTTPPPSLKSKTQSETISQQSSKECRNSEQKEKMKPLSFSRNEFLSPNLGDTGIFDDSQDYPSPTKSPSDKEDSPDTDDYMDNWENDEDVDIDLNSNAPGESSTPCRQSLEEEDSFVTKFVNPSPPAGLLEKPVEEDENKEIEDRHPATPPLDLLNKAVLSKSTNVEKENVSARQTVERQTQLFGMQELYDQFIKSVEASGVDMKNSPEKNTQDVKEAEATQEETQHGSEEALSTSSTSASSTSSSSSSSSESNSSSSSSSNSSATSSDDSNDDDSFTKPPENQPKKYKLDENDEVKPSKVEESVMEELDIDVIENKTQKLTPEKLDDREPRTPSPTPLQKSLLLTRTPPTPVSQQAKSGKSEVARDFKKLKSLEANLSRIQMMRANYDSNDEISEELHKMEMLFLQEKKLILQKYAKTSETPKSATTENIAQNFVPSLPPADEQNIPPPPPPREETILEHNKIFDVNREAIKLTISPMKLPSKPAIFQASLTEDAEKKPGEDKEEADFTEKFVKPAKEVAIVKPMMETKESQESRSRESQRNRRSPAYAPTRDRPRSPVNYRDRTRRSTSRTRFSPQRRNIRGRSLSISPPRRNTRHATPPRRGGPISRFRVIGRRSRSRSRSPSRQFGNRRYKDASPLRNRKRGQDGASQIHYKKFSRTRGSRSRSPRSPQRPRSPRTPPPRRRSYSPDRYSPLPFKPPSPPMRRSMSPMNSPELRRSRSPLSPRRPRSPRSPRSPVSPPSHSTRYDGHAHRRSTSFERNNSISPHAPQYYGADAISGGSSASSSSYYYNMSPNRISLDARINIVLNGPGGHETPPTGYEDYSNYAQYGGAAYMSIPPQPMPDPSGGYYQNPYVSMLPPQAPEGHHMTPPPHHLQTHMQHHSTPPLSYSNIPTINSGVQHPQPPHQYYYNDFTMNHQQMNPVLKELPKVSSVAVQKGNVLEIVPSTTIPTSALLNAAPPSAAACQMPAVESDMKKPKVPVVSWKEEVNNRHVKSAVMRLHRESDNSMRSILKRLESNNQKTEKVEKKKVYFEDGIYPSRDSEDEDRKLVEQKIRRKVRRLRKKRGIDVAATRELLGDIKMRRQPKIDPALEKMAPPPPPATAPPANVERPIYLRPPSPVPLVYFHFDAAVHSMYVSQLEKPIPPRLLNPKCVPPSGPPPPITNSLPSQQSPNINSPNMSNKKDLNTMNALNRAGRNESQPLNSPKLISEQKRESPNPGLDRHMNKGSAPFGGPPGSPHLQTPLPMRHASPPIGFVGMRINSFSRLPPSPLARPPFVPPNIPVMGVRHPHFNMPPPGMPIDSNYGLSPFSPAQQKPHPSFVNMHQRPPNPAYFMNSPSMHHPPPPLPTAAASVADKDHNPHKLQRVVSPQAMIAPYNVKKTV